MKKEPNHNESANEELVELFDQPGGVLEVTRPRKRQILRRDRSGFQEYIPETTEKESEESKLKKIKNVTKKTRQEVVAQFDQPGGVLEVTRPRKRQILRRDRSGFQEYIPD